MARKKTKKTGKTTHRRRHSKMGAIDFMQPLYLIVGAVAGNYIKSALSKTLTFGTTDYSGAAVLAVGVFGKQYTKNPMLKTMCEGAIVSGGISTIHTFMPSLPINGIDQIGMLSPGTIQGMLPPRRVAGVDQIGAIADMSFADSTSIHDF